MKKTGATTQKFLHVAVITTLMCLFGIAADANAAQRYTIERISALSFSGATNSTLATKTFSVIDTSPIAATFTATTNEPWLTIAQASPTTVLGATVVVAVNTNGLAAGVYNGRVIITIPSQGGYTWINSPYSVTVTLLVTSGKTSASGTVVAPKITSQPVSQNVTTGKTATFNVAVTGTAPMSYQWRQNGSPISGATSSSYTIAAATTANNNAQFTVTCSNSMGNATSNPAVLTVTSSAATAPAPAVAPAITTQPASQTIASGKTATFNVAATGTAPMTYQWSMNGAAISGATSSSYTTPAETTSSNNASFTVAVSNSAGGAISNAAVLTVSSASVAPAITTQPASQTITSGKTATFNVVATGTAPMTYQWSMNGTPISGATSSSYTTPAETTSSNNASFTVAVSNSVGSATSNAATLTVSASTLTLSASATSLSFGSVNVSSDSSKTVTLTNSGNANVTISNVTVSGAGFNATGVSSGLILTPGQSATLTASFTPSTAGSLTGSITVASNATNSPDSVTLSGTGVAVVNHSVALSWTPSTSSVIGYNTYSSTVSGGPYTKLTSTPVGSSAYTDTTVQAGQTYYYVVTSVATGNVESTYSSQISANVP